MKVLSINCWGVPYVSKLRKQRMNALAKFINDSDIDICAFQEIWIEEDYKRLCGKTSNSFPYSYYFKSGIIGSGLVVISKYPIIEVALKRFSLNGKPHKIFHSDWFGGKSIGLCRILIDDFKVDFYVTHLHACYSSTNDEYAAHRVAQMWEVLQFIRHTARNNVIVVGDFNCDPFSVGYALITSPEMFGGLGFTDTWIETTTTKEKNDVMGKEVAKELGLENYSLEEHGNNVYNTTRSHPHNILRDCLLGASCNAYSNSFSKTGDPTEHERIDYIFYQKTDTFSCDYQRLSLVGIIPFHDCSFSDHYGLLAQFSFIASDYSETSPHSLIVDSPRKEIESPINVSSKNERSSSSIPLLNPTAEALKPDAVLSSLIDVLSRGLSIAKRNRRNHFIYSNFFGFFALVFFIVHLTLSVYGFTGSYPNLWIIWFIAFMLSFISGLLNLFNFTMLYYIVPQEIKALERIRSEIFIWVKGSSVDAKSINENVVSHILKVTDD
jgi:sphingomyelin phosphodiesterase 2